MTNEINAFFNLSVTSFITKKENKKRCNKLCFNVCHKHNKL